MFQDLKQRKKQVNKPSINNSNNNKNPKTRKHPHALESISFMGEKFFKVRMIVKLKIITKTIQWYTVERHTVGWHTVEWYTAEWHKVE